MLFNSVDFLLFFTFVTSLYYLLPHKLRWIHLLLASCLFYMYFIPIYILILFFTIVIDYWAGIAIENAEGGRRKAYLILSIVANVGVLAFFKYYNLVAGSLNHLSYISHSATAIPYLDIILPIGLSFHTFQAMSYTIEVYRGNFKAERHPGIYALYVMFYPQLVAGPIERPQNLLPQFRIEHKLEYDNIAIGLRLMLWGMIKKVVIADRLVQFTDPIFNHPKNYPGLVMVVAALFFAIQIYCDFSGYSDIAIGAARVMGFRLMTNFNLPYFSKSVVEFWKRWHISLSTWFRDYLYISLGGNRVSVSRMYLNLLIVFVISGLWHGAHYTYLVWGGLHGIAFVFVRMTAKIRRKLADTTGVSKRQGLNNLLSMLITFGFVAFAWIFFRAESLHNAALIVKKMYYAPHELVLIMHTHKLGFLHLGGLASVVPDGLLWIGLFFLAQILELKYNISQRFPGFAAWQRWLVYYIAIAVLLFFGIHNNTQFIYFQF